MIINGKEAALGISVAAYPPEAIDSFVREGFTHFELYVPPALPGESFRSGIEDRLVACVSAHAERIRKNGLQLWSIHIPFGAGWDVAAFEETERAAVEERIRRVIACTAQWQPRVYVIHGCLEPVADNQRSVRKLHAIQTLRALGQAAANQGAKLALEDLPRSCLANDAAETLEMAEAADVQVCFDVNHLLKDRHELFLNKLAHRIVTLHLSDYDGIDERHWLPGKGIVPWGVIYEKLQADGYKGPFLFELGKTEPPATVKEAFIRSISQS